ncbi:barstar family protein [Aeromicrobium sp.]|uniref:barstar family protein n=1 Tax=Aeromicrobium sp. TaxID=1871063 RepID=UPI0030BCE182
MTASYDSLLAGSTSSGLFSWRGAPERDLVEEALSVGWQALTLDTRLVRTVEDFYEELATSWGLPGWFGRDLDALFDTLADLAVQPTVIIWDGLAHLADVDPVHASAVVDIFCDAVGQAPSLAVILRGELGVNDFDGLL